MPVVNQDRPYLQGSDKLFSIRSRPYPQAPVTVLFEADISLPLRCGVSRSLPISMAAEEVNKPSSLPPYPEMIFAAIDGLKQREGSNKSSISNFIESTYGDLPAGHISLLTDHLNKLKDSGGLVFSKNNYMRPDPNAPLKRGRGRPPKAKDPATVEIQDPVQAQSGSEVKKGRGRPKKDPNAPPVRKKVKLSSVPASPSKTGRPRGRPRKVQPELAGVEAN